MTNRCERLRMRRIFVSLAGSSADMYDIYLSERHYKRVKWNDVSMLSMLISAKLLGICWVLSLYEDVVSWACMKHFKLYEKN